MFKDERDKEREAFVEDRKLKRNEIGQWEHKRIIKSSLWFCTTESFCPQEASDVTAAVSQGNRCVYKRRHCVLIELTNLSWQLQVVNATEDERYGILLISISLGNTAAS